MWRLLPRLLSGVQSQSLFMKFDQSETRIILACPHTSSAAEHWAVLVRTSWWEREIFWVRSCHWWWWCETEDRKTRWQGRHHAGSWPFTGSGKDFVWVIILPSWGVSEDVKHSGAFLSWTPGLLAPPMLAPTSGGKKNKEMISPLSLSIITSATLEMETQSD